MTGTFKLFTDENMRFRFRLKAHDGTVMALSRSFPDKPAAVAGITAVRECGPDHRPLPGNPRPRIITPVTSCRPDHRSAIPGRPFSRRPSARGGHPGSRTARTRCPEP
jgi:uncharacterized protein